MYHPTEPYEIKNDFGDLGISNPNLPTDYAWFVNGLKSLIERKHIPQDLLASLSDGRLNKVTQILLENIERGGRSYLLLEGFMRCDSNGYILNPDRPSGWEIDKVSALISSIQAMGIQILLSPSMKETALVLISQMRWELKGDHRSLRTRPGPAHQPWGDRPSYAPYMIWGYQGFPGVSVVLAEILYEAASTYEKLLDMSVEDFAGLSRFGKKRSEGLHRFLHEGRL